MQQYQGRVIGGQSREFGTVPGAGSTKKNTLGLARYKVCLVV